MAKKVKMSCVGICPPSLHRARRILRVSFLAALLLNCFWLGMLHGMNIENLKLQQASVITVP